MSKMIGNKTYKCITKCVKENRKEIEEQIPFTVYCVNMGMEYAHSPWPLQHYLYLENEMWLWLSEGIGDIVDRELEER